MDLLQYFLTQVSDDEIYYQFKDEILDGRENPFSDEKLAFQPLYISDANNAITIFKELSIPPDNRTDEENINFILICYFLFKNNYYLEEFPNLLKNPTSLYDFSYNKVRNYLIANSQDDNGTVQWSTRRKFIHGLEFKTTDAYYINNTMNETFKKVSTRSAEFMQMSDGEKLKEIANVLEFKLKVNGNFISIDSDKYLGFIWCDIVKW